MRCLDIHYRASGDGFDTWGDVVLFGGMQGPAPAYVGAVSGYSAMFPRWGGGAPASPVSAVTGSELSLPALRTSFCLRQLAHRPQSYHLIHGIQQRTTPKTCSMRGRQFSCLSHFPLGMELLASKAWGSDGS